MPDSRTCRTCGWAEWTLTKNGRLNPNHPGRCLFPIPYLRLPICLNNMAKITESWKSKIWPDYSDCPCWKPREAPDAA